LVTENIVNFCKICKKLLFFKNLLESNQKAHYPSNIELLSSEYGSSGHFKNRNFAENSRQ